MHSQLPHHHRTTMWHATLAFVLPSHLPSQLPCHILYNPVTLPRQHPYNLVTMQRQHPYRHLSSTLPRAILSLGHVMYRLPRFICTLPHVNSVLVQLNPKIQNRVTCVTYSCFHVSLLMSSWCHVYITYRTVDVNNMSNWLWLVWDFAYLGNWLESDTLSFISAHHSIIASTFVGSTMIPFPRIMCPK
jgi:hypothetical protein